MQKIISLFVRDKPNPRFVTPEVTPGAEWVIAGEGIATRKWDGTCCRIKDGKLWRRLEWSAEKGPAPSAWEHWDGDAAQRSGTGWLLVGDGADEWLHRQAFAVGHNDRGQPFAEGTYELCGPKVNQNNENVAAHVLVRHGQDVIEGVPRTFDELKAWFVGKDIEGVVWHHPDGRPVAAASAT